jgi:hypothetical protein
MTKATQSGRGHASRADIARLARMPDSGYDEGLEESNQARARTDHYPEHLDKLAGR